MYVFSADRVYSGVLIFHIPPPAGNPCKILEFLHVKPGKGSAFVRTKVKNLISGNSLEKTFRAVRERERARGVDYGIVH